MESNSKPGQVHISEETKRRLTRDKYFFTDCQQNVFTFRTYFVTKIDDNYSEESCLSVHNNLSTTGGHFKSPTCSPTHTPNAETPPIGVSPNGSPRVSPARMPTMKCIFASKPHKQNLRSLLSGNPVSSEVPDVHI
ncbi:unnamed protein product, partial [Oppiella nova]